MAAMAVRDSVVILLVSLSLVSCIGSNVALNKRAWMSSTLNYKHPASAGVDGLTIAYDPNYVIHTEEWQSNAWWKVDLQTSVQSALVILYFRTDLKDRRNGVQLYTSKTNSSDPKKGNLCHSVTGNPDGLDIDDVLRVVCRGTWRYLTVYSETDNDHNGVILDFAEVQVWIGGSNIALDKPARMSTNFKGGYPARRAVDGITRADRDSFVVHTNEGLTTAWWKVDLQAPVQSAEVILYFRTDYITRRNGVQLYTSEKNSREPKEGNLCHTVTGRRDGRGIPDVLDVTCRGTWRYLTVYTETNNDGNGAMLDFAEVQVWTCPVGMYAELCNKDCISRHCEGTTDSCDSFTGACPSEQCQTRWRGTDCATCSADMYGANCNKSCNSRHCYGSTDSCDSITGACSSGMCQMGWTGTDCAECPNGKYGANCAKECSSRHCKTISSACDLVSGACPEDGCEDGWMGSDCSTECSTGKYGVMCGKECSSRHCKTSSTTCDHIGGACPNDGCEAGWMGQDCTLACASGKYGANCTRDCSSRHCNISSLTCDQISGACPSGGCNPGWMGTDCATACASGKYGANCTRDCSSRDCNTSSPTCDQISGACPSGGCDVGWTNCTTASVDKRAVIGGTIGTVLLLLGIGQCIYLRKHERLKADRTKDGVSGTEDIEAIPIPAEEEEYYAELKEEYVGPVPIPAEEDEEYVEPVPVPGEEDEEYVEPIPGPGEEDEDEEYVEPIPVPGEEDEEYVEPIPGPGEEDEYYDDCRS